MELGVLRESSCILTLLRFRCSLSFGLLQVPRDPRFDSLSGEYKPEVFEKTYGFLNDLRKNEKEVMLQVVMSGTTGLHEGSACLE